MFDRSPLTIGKFQLTGEGVKAIGKPTLNQWATAMEFAAQSYLKSPQWISALLQYSTTRQDWQERLSQAIEVTGLSRHTLENLASLGKRLTPAAWRVAPSTAHADKVANLKPEEQVHWLAEAKAHDWTVRELTHHLKAAKRSVVLNGRAETLFTVDVTIQMIVEADNSVKAQDQAWQLCKEAVEHLPKARVIASHARP